MRVSDFDYHLPPESIAQSALADRAASRMLVLHRKEQRWEDRHFRDLPQYIQPGDCLIVNNTKVFPARLYGHRAGHTGKVQVFLVRPTGDDPNVWKVLVQPGRKLQPGERVIIGPGLEVEILSRTPNGERIVRFHSEGDLHEQLERWGHIPLPPYIRRPDQPEDRTRYQTVFAQDRGSVAAPTAGLHFTEDVIEACKIAGATFANLTLHVGLGTFQPLNVSELADVKLHAEYFRIEEQQATLMRNATRRIAVGTTSMRTLETAASRGGLTVMQGDTDIFISPGFQFQAADALLTNFHLPQSSLLILVAAFAGKDFILDAYNHAVASGYRFFSYGDCMLIL